MSTGHNYMHSHSGIEKELDFDKKYVLIDTKYGDKFPDSEKTLFIHNGRQYYKVNTMTFWKKHGVFKNLKQ